MSSMSEKTGLDGDNGAGYLRAIGLRPTQQRMALAGLLFSGEDRHVTAEALYEEATARGIKVSLATVYNTLNQFKEAGLLREVIVHSGKSYFDTRTEDHHHLYDEHSGRIEDVHLDIDERELCEQLEVPRGKRVAGVDIVVRLRESGD